ncbi:hypothetical protein F2Q68_00026875 [Brassica cretica]|uniref:Uncharacterized protein n=1 Tax=Brassica cretica TaxID=69181 RepID=A0A8S9IL79_BRACR|nr:hypothetical protein F2Q68_00026875 [Brassica cretica]
MDDLPKRPVNRNRKIDENLKVSALIGTDGQWVIAYLHNLFSKNEVKHIIQLSVGDVLDRNIRALTVYGSYTVKSGYFLATKAKESQALAEGSLEQGLLELKRNINNS